MELLRENERSASIAAAKVMRITILVFAVVVLLDVLGIFVVELATMFSAFGISTVLLLIPTLIVRAAKQGDPWVKYAIVLCAVLFTGIVTVTMSWHAVLLFVYPIAIASLYFSGGLNIFATVLTIVGVSAGQIAAYRFNFVTDHNYDNMSDVVMFGIIPRALVLLAISAIFTMLCRRTATMLGSLMGAEQQRLMREKSLEVSERLLETVTDLDRISAAAAESNQKIADESGKVMRDSEQNFRYIQSVEENMVLIAQNLIHLSDMSEKITHLTEQAKKVTDENDAVMTQASASMDGICRGTDESKEIIGQLAHQSERIVEIAKVITSISQRTNLLAINASVEAARVGAAGKGFAVVAQEIKRLSEQTNAATAEIDGIIKQVTGNITATVAAMEKNAALTRDGMQSMEQVKRSAAHISTSNSEIAQHITAMNSVIEDVAKSGDTVSHKLVDVSGNVRNNCGAVQHVAAAIEENSAGTANLGTMVRSIKIMAEELELLSK
ncbi:MAG: hypothetical protein IKC24_09200 [Oscillospiraceae bacterium]|nr:hypothetical protein [Oscillospiraceae bacterium]